MRFVLLFLTIASTCFADVHALGQAQEAVESHLTNYSSQRIYAVRVTQTKLDDIKLHVAVYPNQSSTITVLNGPDKGYQAIFNDQQELITWSRVVQWKKDYFVHTYVDGIIVSYPNQQYFEAY